jgi:chaperone BCS1
MDFANIAGITLYSKLINEVLTKWDLNIYTWSFILFVLSIKGVVSMPLIYDYANSAFKEMFSRDESTLELITHQKSYNSLNGKFKRQFYSEYYQALIHFLEKLPGKEMSRFVEVMKIVYSEYYDQESAKEWMLIPDCNYRTKIYDKYQNTEDIYLEVKRQTNYSEKSKDKNNNYEEPLNIFKLIIIIPGKNKFNIINSFMKELVATHKKEMKRKDTQNLFEFMRSYRDEDRRDRQTMEYREFPFKSNKLLDKNIFFDGKADFINFIDRFKDDANVCKNDIYEISGVTKKACILLYGPPGSGKSCIVKGVLNRTGRDGIIVPWSRLKTCTEFCNLFRSQKINDIPFDLKNYVFIFEDFDANKSDILKQRKNDATQLLDVIKNSPNEKEKEKEKESEKESDPNMSLMSLLSDISKKNDDELTLECVLNTLDGIAELQDAMLIFTTNHLENIDPAFYRSGRVDYLLEMKLASVDIIRQMVQTYCQIENIESFQDKFDAMKDCQISTADVQSICFKCGKDKVDECLELLICATNK